jgi:predicted unusual protein kinase regulating ubiquinone biosynthesis (AarF/ABC1/UbiB family)
VDIPNLVDDLTTKQILSMLLMKGDILSKWLETNPDQESKNYVAQVLHDVFIRVFYELNLIHANPNPVNFLIPDDIDSDIEQALVELFMDIDGWLKALIKEDEFDFAQNPRFMEEGRKIG